MIWIATTIVLFAACAYLFIPYWKHRTAIKRFHSYYLTNETKPELQECYVAKTGDKFYRFTNIINAPTNRMLEAEVASKMANLGMSLEYFDKQMEALISHLDRNRITEARMVVMDLKQKSTVATDRMSLELLANCLFLLDGENPAATSQKFLAKKREIWEKDPECYAFFLMQAFAHIRNIHGLSATDLLHYLQKVEAEEILTKNRV